MESLFNEPLLSVLLITAGLVLLFLELFIPSGGILGILGTGGAVLGIYGFFHQGNPAIGIGSILVVALFIFFSIRYWLGKVTLKDVMTPQASTGVDESRKGLLGQIGITQTELRPAGAAMLGNRRVDVVSDGHFVARGVTVKVVDISGNRVVVREVSDDIQAGDA
jgi:membrane-bound serine protease (ClpP class)